MLIKKPSKKPILSYISKLSAYKKLMTIIIILVFIIYTTSLIGFGMVLQKRGEASIYIRNYITYILDLVQHKTNIVNNFINGQIVQPERLAININFLEFKKLEHKRNEAIKAKILMCIFPFNSQRVVWWYL